MLQEEGVDTDADQWNPSTRGHDTLKAADRHHHMVCAQPDLAHRYLSAQEHSPGVAGAYAFFLFFCRLGLARSVSVWL